MNYFINIQYIGHIGEGVIISQMCHKVRLVKSSLILYLSLSLEDNYLVLQQY